MKCGILYPEEDFDTATPSIRNVPPSLRDLVNKLMEVTEKLNGATDSDVSFHPLGKFCQMKPLKTFLSNLFNLKKTVNFMTRYQQLFMLITVSKQGEFEFGLGDIKADPYVTGLDLSWSSTLDTCKLVIAGDNFSK